jgi:conjugative transposon TraM protein
MKTQKFIQQRKFYMALPILVFPFITLIFWALGGGKASTVQAQDVKTAGLNTKLPDPHFNREAETWDKFALYEQARRDSLRYEEARRNDPYFITAAFDVQQRDTTKHGDVNTSLGKRKQYSSLQDGERSIEEKLQQINDHLSRPPKSFAEQQRAIASPVSTAPASTESVSSAEIDRLEQMMVQMQQPGGSDPEMDQIQDVLGKILDIQHPERAREKYNALNEEQVAKTYSVSTMPVTNPVGTMEQPQSFTPMTTDTAATPVPLAFVKETNGFFGLDEPGETDAPINAIEAVVHETQSVVAGSTIKMRLTDDVYLAGKLIPKDHFVYGTVSISGERLLVQISSIQSDNSLYPVALKVYDVDGLPGIYMPGAIERDAAKQATSQSANDVQFSSMAGTQSIGIQAASAGIGAAKSLFSKKVKLIKVTVKAGYKILLFDEHAKAI